MIAVSILQLETIYWPIFQFLSEYSLGPWSFKYAIKGTQYSRPEAYQVGDYISIDIQFWLKDSSEKTYRIIDLCVLFLLVIGVEH